jgi:truncated hemoglobin YjbI/tellurite resistance-related uncharacterized protein
MADPTLAPTLVRGRHTPVFDLLTLPAPLAAPHHSTRWATLVVDAGELRYTELRGDERRDVRLHAGEQLVIAPGVDHVVEPSTDGRFHLQFHREPGDALVPSRRAEPVDHVRRSGPWEHRGRDLDTSEEVHELVVRHYVDIVQDEVLAPCFDFGPGFTDWDAQVRDAADFWARALDDEPDRGVEAILDAVHRRHLASPIPPEAFDRWLTSFLVTVDDGWTGERADHLKKRATGLARAAANRALGRGAWVPAGQPSSLLSRNS